MASMEEILARKAAEQKAKDEIGNMKEQADKIDQQAERRVENQTLDPNSPEAIKQSLEKSVVVAENPQDTLNVNIAKVLEAENIIDHQGRTSLDTPLEVAGGPGSNMATGMQTSASGVEVRANDPRLARSADAKDIEPNPDKMKGTKGVFRAVDIVHYFLGNGTERRAVDGFFYAKTDEDMAMLNHYKEIGVVEEHGGSSTSSNTSTTASTQRSSMTAAPPANPNPNPNDPNRPNPNPGQSRPNPNPNPNPNPGATKSDKK